MTDSDKKNEKALRLNPDLGSEISDLDSKEGTLGEKIFINFIMVSPESWFPNRRFWQLSSGVFKYDSVSKSGIVAIFVVEFFKL